MNAQTIYGVNVDLPDGSEWDADITGRLHIHAEAIGTGAPPWSSDVTDEYRVVVDIYRNGETAASYSASAWGSIHDHAQGRLDAQAMAWLVLDELHSAMIEPDEFISMAWPTVDVPSDAVKRLRTLTALLDFAALAEPELAEAEDLIREHN